MRFYSSLQIISSAIDSFTTQVGKSLAWLSIIMALLIVTLVIVRSLFNLGSIAVQELVTYLHATLFMLTMSYTLKEDGHIRVDIFFRKLNPIGKAWVNLLGAIFLLMPFALFLIFISWQGVLTSWSIQEASSNTGGIPAVFLLKTLIPVGGAMLVLQALSLTLRNSLVITFNNSKDEN